MMVIVELTQQDIAYQQTVVMLVLLLQPAVVDVGAAGDVAGSAGSGA